MNVYCSNLPNDQDLIRTLGSMAVPIPIAFGDCVFWGVGDDDEVIRVCIERKKAGEFASCIRTGRYLHQAHLAKQAGMDVLCLIVEGQTRASPDDGLLEVPVWQPFITRNGEQRRKQIWEPVKPATAYSRFDQYLTELAYLANIIVKRSSDVRETASIIKALWDNFQTPPGKHVSLRYIYSQPPPRVQLVRPSLARRVASELDGIGWEKSGVVARHFGSVRAMVEADSKEWASLDGIGKRTAESIVRELGQ